MVDITVRGAGIFGLAIAWVCACRGARVAVVDPFGAGAGSSGGLVGALAPHVPENWNPKKAFQLDSLLMARSFWHDVQQEGGVDPGYARTGRLQPIADQAALALAHRRALTARDLWSDNATWEICKAAGDWAPFSPTGLLIRDSLSAHLHPRSACAALVAALASRGITVQAKAEDKGSVIWATGVHGLQALSESCKRPVGSGVKGQAALLRHNATGFPQLFAGGVHIIPHSDGTVAVGSTSERGYDEPDTTDAQLDAVVAAAREAVPALAKAEIIARWAGVRPRARSRAPMLGAWPDRDGHFIANGGFKIGFGMAPKVAQVMADLILDGCDTIPEGFRVEASL